MICSLRCETQWWREHSPWCGVFSSSRVQTDNFILSCLTGILFPEKQAPLSLLAEEETTKVWRSSTERDVVETNLKLVEWLQYSLSAPIVLTKHIGKCSRSESFRNLRSSVFWYNTLLTLPTYFPSSFPKLKLRRCWPTKFLEKKLRYRVSRVPSVFLLSQKP